MTSWDFPVSDPIDLKISIPAGSVTVTARATDTARVAVVPGRPGRKADDFVAATRVEYEPGTLSVIAPERFGLHRGSSLDVTVELPEGSSGQIVTASADVRCSGDLRSLAVRTASGSVAAERVTGQVQVNSASGEVRLGDIGGLKAETASGDVQIGTAAGDVIVRTASGDVELGAVASGSTDVTSVSGNISVAVAAGTGVYLDLSTLSGSATSELEAAGDAGAPADDEATVSLRCHTISGDVRVGRAA